MPAAPTARKKLIEVAIPLEAINEQSAREKSIRHGHPSTLHLWWSRKPLATARAVLFSQLVDDPASDPRAAEITDPEEREAWIKRRRQELFQLLTALVKWENSNDEALLKRAHAEILRSTDGHPPAILDPFCGGGSIPLEAQRLGLEAHGSDLNPVAVLITKALVEIPPKFAGRPPVFPGSADSKLGAWPKATGLAEDVRRYGEWMRDEAEKRIGKLYPKATLPDGSEATVIAWIWARTVTCPNPACGIEMPLTSKWWLGKKKGKEAYIVPRVVDDESTPSGKRMRFFIGHDLAGAPTKETDGTVNRTGAVCISCGSAVDFKYIRAQGQAGRIGTQLMATVAEGKRRRIYLASTTLQEQAAQVSRPDDVPTGDLPNNPRNFNTPAYGLTEFSDLFTNRQLTALTTFSDLVAEAREKAHADALAAGLPDGDRLEQGGTGAAAYADAVATYLGLVQSKQLNLMSSLTTWMSDRGAFRETFARQAIPMTWDAAELNPFCESGGSWNTMLAKATEVLNNLPGTLGEAHQESAMSRSYDNVLISTDPPYYDNIGYSDLSDFFYVWLRRSLHSLHPKVLGTMLTPKTDELVANPYRHGGKEGAQEFFQNGFEDVFTKARNSATPDFPITVYYAFKQAEETKDGLSSTGWETLLEGMVKGKWSVTATWPMRTEGSGRLLAKGTNALASSIVLALRPRPEDAPRIDRRRFLATLKAELPAALRDLQQGSIAPVDLPQAAIGPGMAIFSRYSGVLENDGRKMSVKSALQLINAMLDEVLAEQEGDYDTDTRFAVAWFRQFGYGAGEFGDADNLARARNTSLGGLERAGILTARGGIARLLAPSELPAGYDPRSDERISTWEVVHHLVRTLTGPDGDLNHAAAFMAEVEQRGDVDLDAAKSLTFLLFDITQKRNQTADSTAFNALASSWAEIQVLAKGIDPAVQTAMTFEER